ncbi:MAG: hypothetical protein OEX02_14375 [Cyclobacteriaceae bacterium]|nr:hypothetical protein [Cyclobacteriaceae bacterium]
MKTKSYNPSQLEVEIAEAISQLDRQIEAKISANKIIKIENKINQDNPLIRIYLLDQDGDPHEVVVKIIQTPDKF